MIGQKILGIVRSLADVFINWFFIPVVSLFMILYPFNKFLNIMGYIFFTSSILLSVLPDKNINEMMTEYLSSSYKELDKKDGSR